MLIETNDIDPERGHDLLKMLVVPRPIAWVTTLRPNGLVNVAPFACYTMLSFSPMFVGLSIGRVGGKHKKDTLTNIEHGREFVVHSVTEDIVSKAVATARPGLPEESKAVATGLRLAPSKLVAVPRIEECASAMECRLESIQSVGAGHDLVIGRVVGVHLDDRCFPNGTPDFSQFRPVGRLHDELFASLGGIIDLPRPGS